MQTGKAHQRNDFFSGPTNYGTMHKLNSYIHIFLGRDLSYEPLAAVTLTVNE
jgi:hypothetical protein